MAEDCAEGRLDPESIDETVFESYLDTHGIPDPDLMIRTSGEQRLSNYLLWQLAYSEFYFTDVPWPDFTKEELENAVEEYHRSQSHVGGAEEGQADVYDAVVKRNSAGYHRTGHSKYRRSASVFCSARRKSDRNGRTL